MMAKVLRDDLIPSMLRMSPTIVTGIPHSGINQAHILTIPRTNPAIARPFLSLVEGGGWTSCEVSDRPQYRHTTASSWISSKQKGHFFKFPPNLNIFLPMPSNPVLTGTMVPGTYGYYRAYSVRARHIKRNSKLFIKYINLIFIKENNYSTLWY